MCCGKGKVIIPPVAPPPAQMAALYSGAQRGHMHDNSRGYNNLFALTSQGANFDDRFTDGVHQVRVNGAMAHKTGSFLPRPKQQPNFSQIWILDPNDQVERRAVLMSNLCRTVIETIQAALLAVNPLVRLYRYASDVVTQFLQRRPLPDVTDLAVVLVGPSGDDDQRRLNLPTGLDASAEVEAFMPEGVSVGPFDQHADSRQIQVRALPFPPLPLRPCIPANNPPPYPAVHTCALPQVRLQSGGLRYISDCNELYDALRYPLLFPKGRPWLAAGHPLHAHGRWSGPGPRARRGGRSRRGSRA